MNKMQPADKPEVVVPAVEEQRHVESAEIICLGTVAEITRGGEKPASDGSTWAAGKS
jgi:hypothetical protein